MNVGTRVIPNTLWNDRIDCRGDPLGSGPRQALWSPVILGQALPVPGSNREGPAPAPTNHVIPNSRWYN